MPLTLRTFRPQPASTNPHLVTLPPGAFVSNPVGNCGRGNARQEAGLDASGRDKSPFLCALSSTFVPDADARDAL
jgi:hypothetical protein